LRLMIERQRTSSIINRKSTIVNSQCPGWESNPHCPQGRPLYRRPGGPPRVRRLR